MEIRLFFVESLVHFQNWLVLKGLTSASEKKLFVRNGFK